MTDLIFTNAQIVLADEVIRGSVTIRDGRIASVDHGATAVQGNLTGVDGVFLLLLAALSLFGVRRSPI